MNQIEMMNFVQSINKQLDKEYVYRLLDFGDQYIASTATIDGWTSFHPPYLVNSDGNIIKMLKSGEYQNKWEQREHELIYEDEYIKNKKKNLKTPWDK